MDKVKRKRAIQRTGFTKALNAFKGTLGATSDHKATRVAFQMLEMKMKDLEETDNQMRDLMFELSDATDEMIEQECKEVDDYKNKFLGARIDMEEFSTALYDATVISAPSEPSENKKSLKLPRIELRKFDGSVREWLPFWSVFKKIHEDKTVVKEDKFQYLLQAMVPTSRADELVRSFPPTDSNYDKAIAGLRNRFGRENLQIKVYVREFLQLMLHNALSRGKNVEIASLYDKIESHLRALESLGVTTDKCAAMLVPLVESSLPEDLLRVWQRSPLNTLSQQETSESDDSKTELVQLIKFLEGEVRNEMRITMAVEGFSFATGDKTGGVKQKKERFHAAKDVPTATGLLTTKTKIKTCLFCAASDHESAVCEQAKRMSLPERQNSVKQKNACFNCLNIGHGYKKCRLNLKCPWCSRRHVLLMCPFVQKTQTVNDNVAKVAEEKNLANVASDPEVYLKTLRVILYNGDQKKAVRMLIDDGSQRSYVTKAAATRLGYQPIAEQLMNHSLFGGEKSGTVKHSRYLIRVSSLEEDFRCNFNAFDQNVICEAIPTVKGGPWKRELEALNIQISDIDKNDEAISVLVGADIAGKLMTGRRHILKCGLVAVETYLGWTVMGAIEQTEKRDDPVITAHTMFVNSQKAADLWSLDVLGIKDPVENESQRDHQREVKEDFLKTVCKNAEGRYEVKLPWLKSHPALNDNKIIAMRRLQSTVKKLKTDGLFEEYAAIFNEWRSEGIVEYVPEEEKENWGHYLPHRHVVKENSTTRVRPVFDASAKSHPFPSLNECLEKGENLIEQVPSILLRFRKGNIGVISDIRKAFLQISLDRNDRNFLRFLWINERDDIVTLRHCRVVFGVSSSPFILGAVIAMHLDKVVNSLSCDPKAKILVENVKKLSESFYVDNCVTSVNTVDQLHSFIGDAKTVMQSAGFDLRGWEHRDDGSRENRTAVLGMSWNKKQDTLSLNIPDFDEFRNDKVTKRSMLSIAHRIYDPLGFASPIVLCPRLLLQETWTRNVSWDEEVDEKLKDKFLKWQSSLENLNKIEIPRCMIGDISSEDRISLHTFCDASKDAYAAVVFLRIESDSSVRVNFVQAKNRVAPMKKDSTDARRSIPRLELLAATIAVRLTATISDALRLDCRDVYYWSDSSTVITWIRKNSNWATFVYNRVKEIRELSNPEQWRHVPGNLNPADLPSRGCTTDQLLVSRWWEGPEWLRLKSENWPSSAYEYNEEEVYKELKKCAAKDVNRTILLVRNENGTVNDKLRYTEKFSEYRKTVRVLAWIRRFYFNVKNRLETRRNGDLSIEEIEHAETTLMKLIQSEIFTDGINDSRIKHLRPFNDKDGVMRINTRIVLREDSYNFRCPIVLPNNHHVIDLIINEKHKQLKHAGVEITMNVLRENYWIIRGRKTIRSVISKCTSCRRHDARSLESVPVPLPLDRVKDASVFEVVGVDFAGPIYLKGDQKAWICLFTCAVYRAIHLELVTSLSTASFLMALRRHIARRGRPSVVYSDNGTNFVGTANLLKNVDFDKLSKITSTERIEWKFNPPTAAWWGGFWERLIGILKRLLRRTLKKSCLNYEEMLTVLLDCEAIVNSRPITFMSDDSPDVVPLSPSMFLQEVKEIGVLDLDHIENCQLNKKFRYRQKLKEALRQRFRSEYLGALTHKKRKASVDFRVNVGDIVFVEKENVKRLDWPLARVKRVFVGKDNNVRVVRLVTAEGEMTRPIQRIYPLEVKGNESMSNVNDVLVKRYKRAPRNEPLSNVCEKNDEHDVNNANKEQGYVTRSGRKIVQPDRLGL